MVIKAGRRARKKGCHRFEANRPLELAQIDILEFFINKLKVYLLLLQDDYSRFIVGWLYMGSDLLQPYFFSDTTQTIFSDSVSVMTAQLLRRAEHKGAQQKIT